MNKCNNCYWNMNKGEEGADVVCTHEDFEVVRNSGTQYTYQCIGYLGDDFEKTFWLEYEMLNNEIKNLDFNEIIKVRGFIEEIKKGEEQ